MRAIVLCAQGTAFCAGANFGDREPSTTFADSPRRVNPALRRGRAHVLLHQAGGGRRARPGHRWRPGPLAGGRFPRHLQGGEASPPTSTGSASTPASRLTVTLPRVIGMQKASLMFYTGRRIEWRGSPRHRPGRRAGTGRPGARRGGEAGHRDCDVSADRRDVHPARPCGADWSTRSAMPWRMKAWSRMRTTGPRTSRKVWPRWRRGARRSSPESRGTCHRHHRFR